MDADNFRSGVLIIRVPSARALALDAALGAAVRDGNLSDHRKAVVLAEIDQEQLHHEFGYASLADYARERFDIGARQTMDLLRIGKKLPELPLLDRAMADGQLGWTKAREIAKVGSPGNEADWIELARTVSSRVLERAVQVTGKDGAPPSQEQLDEVPEQVLLTFPMSALEAEMVRTALQYVRTLSGPGAEHLDNGPLLAMILQRMMADADPETAPSPDRYRFVVESRSDGAETHVVPGEAGCDAEVVEMGTGPERGHTTRTIPPARRVAVLHRDQFRCQVPGCANRLWLDIHHVMPRETGGSHAESNLCTLCCIHHRLVHDQYLEVAQGEAGGFRFVFPDGRKVVVRARVKHRKQPNLGRSSPASGP